MYVSSAYLQSSLPSVTGSRSDAFTTMEAVDTNITQNNKIKHTFAI